MGRKLTKKFLRVTHEIVGAIRQRSFTAPETSVLFAILEKTFGEWDAEKREAKDRNEFTLDTLVEATGLFKGRVHDALESLVEDGIVRRYLKGSSRVKSILGIEDHTENWKRPLNSVRESRPRTRSGNSDRLKSGNPDRELGPQIPTGLGRALPTEIGPQIPTETSRQSQSQQAIPAAVDHVEAIYDSSRRARVTAATVPICVDGTVPNFPRQMVESMLVKLGCLVLTGENLTAATRYFALPGHSEERKLAKLAIAVEKQQVKLKSNSSLRGKIVLWAFEEATLQLEMDTFEQAKPDLPPVKYYTPAPGDEFDSSLYNGTAREPKTSTPLGRAGWIRSGGKSSEGSQAPDSG